MLIRFGTQNIRFYALLSMIGVCFYGCIESFNAEFVDFVSAIVVEATITDEMKQQQVFLTRTFEFGEVPSAEFNANVRVVAGDVTYNFEETERGVYVSTQEFAAQPNTTYQLQISAQDGRTYRSDEIMFPAITQTYEVRAERITNDDGEDGIAILVDSFDPTGSSSNYRYTYEEAYRIIAPEWRPVELVPDLGPEAAQDGCDMITIPKQIDDRICYATVLSNSIIQTNTSDLEEDRVSNFMVRFINRNNYIISHRYSILVRQFVQSNTAFAFYETLAQFSASESLFSETQPGFLEGNVYSDQNRDEKVLGFFDVASVKEQRIFFNYTDLYPNEPLPPYAEPCTITSIPLRFPDGGCRLRPAIEEFNSLRFLSDNNNPDPLSEGPFFTVPRACGDCTALGELEVPEFWIE